MFTFLATFEEIGLLFIQPVAHTDYLWSSWSCWSRPKVGWKSEILLLNATKVLWNIKGSRKNEEILLKIIPK